MGVQIPAASVDLSSLFFYRSKTEILLWLKDLLSILAFLGALGHLQIFSNTYKIKKHSYLFLLTASTEDCHWAFFLVGGGDGPHVRMRLCKLRKSLPGWVEGNWKPCVAGQGVSHWLNSSHPGVWWLRRITGRSDREWQKGRIKSTSSRLITVP